MALQNIFSLANSTFTNLEDANKEYISSAINLGQRVGVAGDSVSISSFNLSELISDENYKTTKDYYEIKYFMDKKYFTIDDISEEINSVYNLYKADPINININNSAGIASNLSINYEIKNNNIISWNFGFINTSNNLASEIFIANIDENSGKTDIKTVYKISYGNNVTNILKYVGNDYCYRYTNTPIKYLDIKSQIISNDNYNPSSILELIDDSLEGVKNVQTSADGVNISAIINTYIDIRKIFNDNVFNYDKNNLETNNVKKTVYRQIIFNIVKYINANLNSNIKNADESISLYVPKNLMFKYLCSSSADLKIFKHSTPVYVMFANIENPENFKFDDDYIYVNRISSDTINNSDILYEIGWDINYLNTSDYTNIINNINVYTINVLPYISKGKWIINGKDTNISVIPDSEDIGPSCVIIENDIVNKENKIIYPNLENVEFLTNVELNKKVSITLNILSDDPNNWNDVFKAYITKSYNLYLIDINDENYNLCKNTLFVVNLYYNKNDYVSILFKCIYEDGIYSYKEIGQYLNYQSECNIFQKVFENLDTLITNKIAAKETKLTALKLINNDRLKNDDNSTIYQINIEIGENSELVVKHNTIDNNEEKLFTPDINRSNVQAQKNPNNKDVYDFNGIYPYIDLSYELLKNSNIQDNINFVSGMTYGMTYASMGITKTGTTLQISPSVKTPLPIKSSKNIKNPLSTFEISEEFTYIKLGKFIEASKYVKENSTDFNLDIMVPSVFNSSLWVKNLLPNGKIVNIGKDDTYTWFNASYISYQYTNEILPKGENTTIGTESNIFETAYIKEIYSERIKSNNEQGDLYIEGTSTYAYIANDIDPKISINVYTYDPKNSEPQTSFNLNKDNKGLNLSEPFDEIREDIQDLKDTTSKLNELQYVKYTYNFNDKTIDTLENPNVFISDSDDKIKELFPDVKISTITYISDAEDETKGKLVEKTIIDEDKLCSYFTYIQINHPESKSSKLGMLHNSDYLAIGFNNSDKDETSWKSLKVKSADNAEHAKNSDESLWSDRSGLADKATLADGLSPGVTASKAESMVNKDESALAGFVKNNYDITTLCISKPDNSGYPVFIKLANVTDYFNTSSLTDLNNGVPELAGKTFTMIGNIYSMRKGNNCGVTKGDICIKISCSRRYQILESSSNSTFKPMIIKLSLGLNKYVYYLGIMMYGSAQDLRFEGICENTFIDIPMQQYINMQYSTADNKTEINTEESNTLIENLNSLIYLYDNINYGFNQELQDDTGTSRVYYVSDMQLEKNKDYDYDPFNITALNPTLIKIEFASSISSNIQYGIVESNQKFNNSWTSITDEKGNVKTPSVPTYINKDTQKVEKHEPKSESFAANTLYMLDSNKYLIKLNPGSSIYFTTTSNISASDSTSPIKFKFANINEQLPASVNLAGNISSLYFYDYNLNTNTMQEYLYKDMFAVNDKQQSSSSSSSASNESLSEDPSADNTKLENAKYYNKYTNVSAIYKASDLILPIEQLATSCYETMFSDQSTMIIGPTLPASSLVKDCYKQIFLGCTSLTSIKILASTLEPSYFGSDDNNNIISNDNIVNQKGILYINADKKINDTVLSLIRPKYKANDITYDWDIDYISDNIQPAGLATITLKCFDYSRDEYGNIKGYNYDFNSITNLNTIKKEIKIQYYVLEIVVSGISPIKKNQEWSTNYINSDYQTNYSGWNNTRGENNFDKLTTTIVPRGDCAYVIYPSTSESTWNPNYYFEDFMSSTIFRDNNAGKTCLFYLFSRQKYPSTTYFVLNLHAFAYLTGIYDIPYNNPRFGSQLRNIDNSKNYELKFYPLSSSKIIYNYYHADSNDQTINTPGASKFMNVNYIDNNHGDYCQYSRGSLNSMTMLLSCDVLGGANSYNSSGIYGINFNKNTNSGTVFNHVLYNKPITVSVDLSLTGNTNTTNGSTLNNQKYNVYTYIDA